MTNTNCACTDRRDRLHYPAKKKKRIKGVEVMMCNS